MMAVAIEDVAKGAIEWFALDTRPNGESFRKLKDDAPDWIRGAVYAAHENGEILPDDWTYEIVRCAFDYLAEGGDPDDMYEWADGMRDTYHVHLIAWLASYPGAMSACDDAIRDPQFTCDGISDCIAYGQFIAARRIGEAIAEACKEECD